MSLSELDNAEAFALQRAEMVERQLRARHIRDPRVLRAMGALPRELFVPPELRSRAYEDNALPLAHGATISQPYVVAAMTEALQLSGLERVLEIGTGSGYQTALLAELAAEVYSLELEPELARSASELLERMHYQNVQIKTGDGRSGWPQPAAVPFDALLCAAATPEAPASWLLQLRDGARAVVPIGSGAGQQLRLLEKHRGRWRRKDLFPVRFVPLR